MDTNKLLRFATMFYSVAMAEKLPNDAKDLDTILKNIETLETYSARKKYAERNLKHLSSGSSRIVYLSPERTVIKLAKNDKGIAQNEAEVKSGKCGSHFVNKTMSHGAGFCWIEVPFLDNLSEKDFEEATGIDFEDFGKALEFRLKGKSTRAPKNFDRVKKTAIYKEIADVAKKMDLTSGDLGRISSWRSKDGTPILADSGLTYEIFETYYEGDDSST